MDHGPPDGLRDVRIQSALPRTCPSGADDLGDPLRRSHGLRVPSGFQQARLLDQGLTPGKQAQQFAVQRVNPPANSGQGIAGVLRAHRFTRSFQATGKMGLKTQPVTPLR